MKSLLFCFLLLTPVFCHDFSSSSESCEDGGGHHHGGGRPRPPGRPPGGNGGGGANGGCGNGWRRFNRPSGPWCIRVFRGQHLQANAESECVRIGGALTGLQDPQEINYITNSFFQLNPTLNSGSIWIGAKRTNGCLNRAPTGNCAGANGFFWTDGSASGTGGFQFNQGQPDNAHGATQNCMVLLASKSPTVFDGRYTWQASKLDDVGCGWRTPGNIPRKIMAFACGKKPSN